MENTVVKNYTMATIDEFLGGYTLVPVGEFLTEKDTETAKRSALVSKSLDNYIKNNQRKSNKYDVLKKSRVNA